VSDAGANNAQPHHLAAPPVIDAHDVEKRFGSTVVVQHLGLQVHAGEIFGLIGPSGSGKSTTVHLLCGHLRPTNGTLSVLGERPVAYTTATRARIGYMPQQFALQLDLTLAQNVNFVAGLYGLPEWRNRERLREVLELVELWDARDRVARRASGGMQRRLALAAALVHHPQLLFADEPTANLDPILRTKLWAHFRSLAGQGRTLLITTQYIDEAEYCDRVGLMFGGTIIAEGTPDELRRRAFGGDVLDVAIDGPAPHYAATLAVVDGVQATELSEKQQLRVTVVQAEQAIPVLLRTMEASGVTVRAITHYRPTFDEIFVRLIEQHSGTRPPVGQIQTSAAGTNER
jgi:ABC-2 type transport system ATP-binding protein